MTYWPKRETPKDDDTPQGVEARLAYEEPSEEAPELADAGHIDPKLLDAAVIELAKLLVQPRPAFDPTSAAAAPFGMPKPRDIAKANPVRQAKPDSWSVATVRVGDEVLTIAPRNIARETLKISHVAGGAVELRPIPGDESPALPLAAGDEPVSLDVLGPVYAVEAAAGAPGTVRVVQTFYGEGGI